MASSGVSSGVFTGSDFSLKVSPKPAVNILTVPTSKAVNNTSYYDGSTRKVFSDIVSDALPSSSTVSKVKTGLSAVSKSPKVTPYHLLVDVVANGALYGLNQLYPEEVITPSPNIAPKPVVATVPEAIAPSSKTAPQSVNEKTVQIINNFSPEILGKLTVESDTDLITALVNASVAQNQSTIMGVSVLNTQLGMLNEQFFGFLAYLDLMLSAMWDSNELVSLNTASSSDSASDANAVSDTIAESILRVGDKLTHFSENQEWFQNVSPTPSFSESLSPRDAEFAKNYEHGKGESDTNSLGASDLDFIDSLMDDMDISPSMLTSYVRFDSILNKAKLVSEGNTDDWESLMEAMYL